MKIKDLVVNETCGITLVVRSATPSETKAKKPYLKLELFDGTDTINANYWDWSSGKVPEVNAILDIHAQVTEWMGNKQLNVKSMVTNTQRTLAEFAPDSGHDIGATYKEAYELMASVGDDFLRDIALHALEELQNLWLLVPGAVTVHHAYTGGTLVHSLSTAKIAAALAKAIPEANRDLCVVGAMLHDLGKLFTYRMRGISIDMTDEGLLYEHSFMGAEFIGNFAEAHLDDTEGMNALKLRLLRHIILSHHGKLEYGAAITPKCIEAMIVNAADGLDASTEQLRAAASKAPENARWTQRIYTLGNGQFLTPDYVSAVMKAQSMPL